MPRPKKPRFVSAYPVIAAFVPHGISVTGEVFMSVEELDAIRQRFQDHAEDDSRRLMGNRRQLTTGRWLPRRPPTRPPR